MSRHSFLIPPTLTLAILIADVDPAAAAEGLDGAVMGWPWTLPFIGLLLTIATGPLLFPHLGTVTTESSLPHGRSWRSFPSR